MASRYSWSSCDYQFPWHSKVLLKDLAVVAEIVPFEFPQLRGSFLV
jgi:hypothetical protein